jgi:hypothetical protein
MIERFQAYQVRTGVIPDDGSVHVYEQRTQNDAPFRWTGLGVYFPCGGAVLVRWARADGRYVQRIYTGQVTGPYGGLVSAQAIGGQWAPVFPNMILPISSTVEIQIVNISGQEIEDLRIVFTGTKLYAPGAVWAPEQPARYTWRPYTYSIPLILPAVSTLTDVIFRVRTDADFCWQSSQFNDGLGGLTNDVGLRIRDASGKAYMNDYIWVGQLCGVNFGERPGLLYPDFYIPRNQVMSLDVQRNDVGGTDAPNASLLLKGYKVYPQ